MYYAFLCRVICTHRRSLSVHRVAGQLGGPGEPFVDVAVKILKDDDWRQPASSSIDDFKREVKIVSSFDHDNILRLIAIVTVGQSNRSWLC